MLLATSVLLLTGALLVPHAAHHPPAVPRARPPQLQQTTARQLSSVERWLAGSSAGAGSSAPPVSESLSSVLAALFGACQTIAGKISTASCDSTSCFSDYMDDEMLAIDLLAEEVLFAALTETGVVAIASSESSLFPTPPRRCSPSPSWTRSRRRRTTSPPMQWKLSTPQYPSLTTARYLHSPHCAMHSASLRSNQQQQRQHSWMAIGCL